LSKNALATLDVFKVRNEPMDWREISEVRQCKPKAAQWAIWELRKAGVLSEGGERDG